MLKSVPDSNGGASTTEYKQQPLAARSHGGGTPSCVRIGRRILLALLPVAIGLAVWQGVAMTVPLARHLEPGTFPTPLDTFRRLADLWIQRDPLLGYSVLAHTLASLWRWVLGFGVAGVLGLLVGTALGRVRVLHTAFMPMVHALQLIPGLAWVPVTILMFGLNDGATVFMITISAFAPMVINVAAGMRATHEAHIAVARMVGASSTMTFWRVLVPSSIPHILSGIRVALGNSWRVVVAAEMVLGTGLGLGYSIIQSRWTLDYASSFACIIVIGLIGLATEHFLIGRIERMTIKRWGAGGTA